MIRRRRFSGPSAELRIYFLALVMLSALGIVVAKLWWEQVARGKEWERKIASRSEVKVRIPSVRGEIRDRNGVTLVANRASYEVDFYLPDMVRDYRNRNGGKVPLITYEGKVKQMLKEKKEEDVVEIVSNDIIPRLQDLNLARDYNAQGLQRHYRNNTLVPFTYLENIDFATIAKFSENNVGLAGVDISVRPVREYRYGALAAHLLGYVGAPNDIDKLPDIQNYTFYQPDVEGKSQIEEKLDKYIRGRPGVRVMARSVKGAIEGEVRREAPQQGNNILLTIDARIQFIAERALRAGGIGRGAAVVVDPRNGDILAMASVPSYNPNQFIPSVSADDWKTLTDDDTDPLTNRAIQSYAPGSTFKAVTALAGLRKGLTARNTYNCSGGVTYGAKYMKCWVTSQRMSPHGTLNLSDALKCSCNAFFYQWGNKAGIDQIGAVGDALGLGSKSGVPLSGESPGVLPGPAWLARVSPQERWSDGYTANVSIGQGSCEASPLQMAMVTATIANRGTSFEPRLVKRIVDQGGNDARDENGQIICKPEPVVRADLRKSGVSDEQIEMVRRGMWKVINDAGGTGKKAQVKGIEVAGKTGTAQFWREVKGRKEKDNHTWFICFAPYEKPEFAICIMVEGGKSGGGTSAPIAQRILEESYAVTHKGYDPGVEPMDPAPGHFKPIMEVVYQKTENLPVGNVEDEQADDHEAPPTPTATKRERQLGGARPDIRAEPDARGRLQNRRPSAPPPPERKGFLQRIFGPRNDPPPPRKPFNQPGRPR